MIDISNVSKFCQFSSKKKKKKWLVLKLAIKEAMLLCGEIEKTWLGKWRHFFFFSKNNLFPQFFKIYPSGWWTSSVKGI